MRTRRKARTTRKRTTRGKAGIISCKMAKNGVPVCKIRKGGKIVTRFVSKRRAAKYI